MEQITAKQRFFEENVQYKELKPSAETATIGEFQDIDELEDEVWLLQCPKGMDLAAELEQQKIKLCGRTSYNTTEAVSVEFPNPEAHAFGYCTRKGRYSLRLLPVRGSIVVRKRLRPMEEVTAEVAEECCPAAGRVPMPEIIKVRHPLHGHQFDERLRVSEDIAARLKEADEVTAQVLHEVRTAKRKRSAASAAKHKQTATKVTATIQIESDDEEDDGEVEFVSETNAKKKKKKRKHSEATEETANDVLILDDESETKKKRKKKKSKDANASEDVSQDLQWLQNL